MRYDVVLSSLVTAVEKCPAEFGMRRAENGSDYAELDQVTYPDPQAGNHTAAGRRAGYGGAVCWHLRRWICPGGFGPISAAYMLLMPYMLLLAVGISIWFGIDHIQVSGYEAGSVGLTAVHAMLLTDRLYCVFRYRRARAAVGSAHGVWLNFLLLCGCRTCGAFADCFGDLSKLVRADTCFDLWRGNDGITAGVSLARDTNPFTLLRL